MLWVVEVVHLDFEHFLHLVALVGGEFAAIVVLEGHVFVALLVEVVLGAT